MLTAIKTISARVDKRIKSPTKLPSIRRAAKSKAEKYLVISTRRSVKKSATVFTMFIAGEAPKTRVRRTRRGEN